METPTPREYPADRTADERTTLLMMRAWYRQGMVTKVAGLSNEAARRRLVPSATAIVSVVKHLALVEDHWFTYHFAGLPEMEPWASAPFDQDPDWDYNSAFGDTLADTLTLYQAACDRSDVIIEHAELDQISVRPERVFTLRFVLVHMIEETARHLGQLDILRELLDGSTGE